MEPSLGDQIERAVGRNVIAEVDFDVVVARNSLVLSQAEVIEIFSVERAQDSCYIVVRYRPWRGQRHAACPLP